jgi:hypothetical protein
MGNISNFVMNELIYIDFFLALWVPQITTDFEMKTFVAYIIGFCENAGKL